MGLIYVYKPIGKTPLEIVESVKSVKYKKISYAGRLDPMAHGTLLLLTDEDCYKQYNYNNLNKIYKFKLLCGVETDTNDVLGKIVGNKTEIDIPRLREKISSLVGKQELPYPLFSSKRYNGKPLWYYGKYNKRDEIKVYPNQTIMINKISILDGYEMDKGEIIEYVKTNIGRLDKKHDFRQEEILESWKNIIECDYKVIEIEANVGSGTYIRGISRHLSESLNISTLCLDIYRTKIY
jgi:tRNA pseudouridine(55) synthase